MHKVAHIAFALAMAATFVPSADSSPDGKRAPAPTPTAAPFVLGPPTDGGPVLVRASFLLRDINEIDDEAGVAEKVYQGGYQFNEVGIWIAIAGVPSCTR